MICSICHEEGYSQTYIEPGEPCLCGELAVGSPWEWDGWSALVNVARYRVAAVLFRLANRLVFNVGYWRLR